MERNILKFRQSIEWINPESEDFEQKDSFKWARCISAEICDLLGEVAFG